MRILYVLTDAKIGGAETLVETLALRKFPGDHAGLVVLLGPDQLSPRLEYAFDSVQYLNVSEASRNLPGMVRGLERAVKSFGPDIIHSNLFHADLVSMLARVGGVPKVTTIHTQGFGPGDHYLTKLIAHAVGRFSFLFNAAVPTPGSSDFAARLGYRNLVDPIANSANIADTSLFKEDTKVFSTIGRFHPVKGHAVLFRAFAEVLKSHPDWMLVCTGPGLDHHNTELMGLVEDAGLSTALRVGSLVLNGSTDNVQGVLASSTALIISSLYGETFPMVGVEANGAGIPVIATDVGNSSRFTFDDKYVVEPGNAAALAVAMNRYADLTPSDRAAMSRAVRARALAEFDPRDLVTRYRDVYTSLISRQAIA